MVAAKSKESPLVEPAGAKTRAVLFEFRSAGEEAHAEHASCQNTTCHRGNGNIAVDDYNSQ
jgi:hypothetical protein